MSSQPFTTCVGGTTSRALLLTSWDEDELVEVDRLFAGEAAAGPASAGRVAGAAPPAAVLGWPRGFWVEPFEPEEGVRAGDERDGPPVPAEARADAADRRAQLFGAPALNADVAHARVR